TCPVLAPARRLPAAGAARLGRAVSPGRAPGAALGECRQAPRGHAETRPALACVRNEAKGRALTGALRGGPLSGTSSSADIVYVDDQQPGITRRKVRRGWGYWDADGRRIADRDAIDRLNGIGLPPAYANAWFCPDPRGHIQATGQDERGR